MKEDYVSYGVAKLLKEKGFDECIFEFYEGHKIKYARNGKGFRLSELGSDMYYPHITHQMAMKWLREVYGLHISLEPCYDYDSMHVVFLAFVQNVADVHKFFDGRKNVASYPNAEKSYELAIKYCLENLI